VDAGESGRAGQRAAAAAAQRLAVVDLGSNSVRLVVFEGLARNPVALFNEKAVLRLGRGIETTGLLGAEAMAQTKVVLRRYHAVARAMGVGIFEVLATAAVREARNGADFMRDLEGMLPDVPMTVLSGTEEAELSAAGVVCGIPQAEGILADIGGG
jgi:exopolyphosphatase/guanosine-5'-triphosphate,3'-diphosphate pyrophosphatase